MTVSYTHLDVYKRQAEQCAEERQRPYLQYRIGKMYAAGLGYELPVVPDEEGGDGKAVRDYRCV